MKNKKIISLMCVLAMICTMFSAFTALAEDVKGINLAGSLSEDGKTITIDATSTGTNGPLSSFGIAVEVPEGVTNENVKADSTVSLTSRVVDGVLTVAFLDMSGEGVTFADNKLATITISLAEALSEDTTFTLLDKSSIADADGETTVKKGMPASTVTVNKWVDPDAPTPKPTAPARPTQAPIGGDEPVPTAVPAEGKGIALTSSIDSTNTVVTINAEAVGTNGPLSSFGIAVEVPEGAEAKADSTASLTSRVVDGVLTVAFLDMSGEGVTFADNKLATITITLPNALTAPMSFTLLDKSSIADADGETTVKKGMTATSTVVVPSEEIVTPDPIDEVELKDFVADDAADKVAAEEEAGNTVYVTVEVKKNDGTPAKYGEDFAAKYNDKVLTEAEYSNLISGYGEGAMVDVINGLTFEIYNDAVESISTTVNSISKDTGAAEQITDPVVDKPINGTPQPSDGPVSATKLSVTPTSKTVTTNSAFTVAATVKNPVEGGKVEFAVENPESKIVLVLVESKDLNNKNVASASLLSTDKTGKGKVIVKYVDAEGNAIPGVKDVTVNVTVNKAGTTNNNTSKDNTSDAGNTGIIAGPNTPVNGGDYFGTTQFTDLGDVQWAQEAINTLASKGIVNGRDANTFDPNANITRAEYCQILVGAIGKNQEAADSNFDDVASDAWYYHSVSVASKYGIVSGYGDGNFGPNSLITRQDMALMTMKAAQVMGKDLTAVRTLTFGDADQISDYAAEAVTTLSNAGIINGMSEVEFAPKANATRAQAAVILYQTFVK